MGRITKRRSARAVTPLPTGPRHGSRGANARQTVRLSRICAPGPMALHRFSDHTETLSNLPCGEPQRTHRHQCGPPDGSRARAIEVSYRYAEGAADPRGLIHGGLAVPLEESGSRVGYLAVYTRTAGRRFGEDDVRQLEELTGRAAPALENAQRFREARQLADLDALTGLHNRRYFHETLARECARAHRYNRRLGLIVFDIDDFKNVNDKVGHLAGDAVLAEAAERVREVIRTADIPCRVGGDGVAGILPEAGIEQAEQLFARIQATIAAHPIGQAGGAPRPARGPQPEGPGGPAPPFSPGGRAR